MMLLGCARFTSQLHAFPEEVPVATDPCLQASSFCRQVRDTYSSAGTISCTSTPYCIMYHVSYKTASRRPRVRGILSRCQFTRQAAAGQSQRLGCPVQSERRAACCSVDAQIRSLAWASATVRIHTSPFSASVDGTCGQSHLQRGLV
ncbi:hypothetical protein HDV62DRAFT_231320 [Trichoderma sp. SZMC 28011]